MPVPVISIAQMREWENATWASGQTEGEVIRRVGVSLAQCARALTRPGDLILVLAGKGNNGADARACREHLQERRVDLLEVTDPVSALPKLDGLLSLGPKLVIDGLFGIGLNRPLSAEWIQCIERLNQAGLETLSIDVPSGLDADTGTHHGAAVRASTTLTVGAPKIGLLQDSAWEYVGRLEVTKDVGLGKAPSVSELLWTLPADFLGFPPARRVATHKGTYGHLTLIAGSLGYHGAAVIAARASQRTQPGLITLFTLEQVYHVVASQLQAVMVSPLRAENEIPAATTAFLAGPGLAAAEAGGSAKTLVRHLWRDSDLPVIVDASALDWTPIGSCRRDAIRVLTPHPGEASRLLATSVQQIQGNRPHALRAISKRFGDCWVVLKGHQTLIGRSTGPIYVNASGNPYLAQGGSGDALAGFIAGLLTQPHLRTDPLRCLQYAVWQHGAVADQLQATRPNWVVEDLVEGLGSVRVPGTSQAEPEELLGGSPRK